MGCKQGAPANINMMQKFGHASSCFSPASIHECIISWAIRPWPDYSIQLYKKRNESSFHSGFVSERVIALWFLISGARVL